MAINPVVHFELLAEDRKRMTTFYTTVFGWEANQLGPEMGNYVVVMTAESDAKGPKRPGAINGGLYQKTPEMGPQYPSVVIGVENLEASMKKVIATGGKILDAPKDIPGVGKFVSFVDTEGNRLSILQPLQM